MPKTREYQPYYGVIPEGANVRYAEVHMHNHTYGGDGHMSPEEIVDRALERGLSYLAVTEHDTRKPAARAANYSRRMGYEKLIHVESDAAELSTTGGHILALKIKKDIPPGMSAKDTIRAIHSQGGLAIVAHPGLKQPASSLSLEEVSSLYDDPDKDVQPNGLEILNAGAEAMNRVPLLRRHFGPNSNDAAKAHHEKDSRGAVTAGTDGHGRRVGLVATAFWGETFETSVLNGQTAVVFDPAVHSRRVALGEAFWYGSAGPRKALRALREGRRNG